MTYKDDPTIFSWELANEPRCIDSSLPTSGTCTEQTLTNWADEMSTYIKSLDPNHMVSVGDEGFHPGVGGTASAWPYNVTDGVNHVALPSLPNVDFGTFHLYPCGFVVTITVTDTGTTATKAWTVSWTFNGNQQITSPWNAHTLQSGTLVTGTNVDYNGVIQPGQSTQFGFQASYSGTNSTPTLSCTTS